MSVYRYADMCIYIEGLGLRGSSDIGIMWRFSIPTNHE